MPRPFRKSDLPSAAHSLSNEDELARDRLRARKDCGTGKASFPYLDAENLFSENNQELESRM